MTIKKYELSDAVSEQSLKSSTESLAMMAQDSGGGTITPFFEFIYQLYMGSWEGGKVNGLGYIEKNEFEKTEEPGEYDNDLYYSGLITRFVHSSEFDLEAQLSKMYSMMYVATIPSSSSEAESGNNGNENNNSSTSSDFRYIKDTIDFENVKVDYEIVISGLYVVAKFSLTKDFANPCGILIKCVVANVSQVLFDGTESHQVMDKVDIGTKAYMKSSENQHLMTLEFYNGGALREVLTIS